MRPNSVYKYVLFLPVFCFFCFITPTTTSASSNSKKVSARTNLLFSKDSYRTKIFTSKGLSLYRYVTDGPAVPFEESYAPDTAQETAWFLLKEDTNQKVQITRYNYKSVLQLLLSDRPDILQKLGKKGYRFSDIQSIVEEYNQKW